ncbi:hypothetical protein DFH94DRAFT_759057 [Russula ochroleuca]|uniref:Uncharacterized protein n=1 Tax=Russula ochroleuca TaxID=152965 RepID=A0A9P5MS07_9AGAM|nr:hypothetical protein DFH94DRAFT_759057 [Russula ochroleuca]
MNPPATPHRLPSLPGDHTAAATEPPSQSQPVSPPPRLDKSNSRREAKRATEGPTSDKKEQKGIPAPEEYETRDSTTTPDGAKRRKGGLNPPTSYNPKGIQDANASVERTYSSNSSRGNDSSALRLSEIGKSRGKVEQPSASTPSLVKETIFTTPPPSSPSTLKETIFTAPSSVSTSSQPKHVTRVPSNSDVIVSRVEQKPHRARPPTVADSQIKSTPSMAPTVVGTPFNQEGHDPHEPLQPQVPPGFLTETEQREEKAMAALEGRYHFDPVVGNCNTTFSKFPPGPTSVKQRGALNNNEGKLQLGGLNREIFVTEKLSSIANQPAQQEFKQPVVIDIQQNAGPTQVGPPGDRNHGRRPQGLSKRGEPPGEDEPPGRGEPPGGGGLPEQLPVGRREPTQLSLPDDGSRGEGPRGSLSGEGRPPGRGGPPGGGEPSGGEPSGEGPQGPSSGPLEGGRPPGREKSGGRPLGGRGPTPLSSSDDVSRREGPRGSSGGDRPSGGRPSGRGEPPGGGRPPGRHGPTQPSPLDDIRRGEGLRGSSRGEPPDPEASTGCWTWFKRTFCCCCCC